VGGGEFARARVPRAKEQFEKSKIFQGVSCFFQETTWFGLGS
jgi:hypothetical protein